MRQFAKYVCLITVLLSASDTVRSDENAGSEYVATIIFVRHGETKREPPSYPLSESGFERASHLADTLARAQLTHVYASHTLRARQMVEETAEIHGLDVVPFPLLGSQIDGQMIHDASDSDLAIEPLTEALRGLPSQSRAVVGVNSNNIFAIMHALGVPVGTSEDQCAIGDTCVPCLDNTCFPRNDDGGEHDNLWILTLRGVGRKPELIWLRYGRVE